ncbi:MAG: hypothetical protein ACFFFG_18755, partial [Candidatus Thorarchaeota archaeon]
PDVGPHKCLTFFAFDFLAHNRLLWGDDLLTNFLTIPEPIRFAKERLEWIRKMHERNRRKDQSKEFRIMATLGSIIRHYAVLTGLRSLKRADLYEWIQSYEPWLQIMGNHNIFEKYFQYISGKADDPPFNNTHWVKQAKAFIRKMLY